MSATQAARQIGTRAHAMVLDPGRLWSVLASVSDAIYLESATGEILWIATRSSALHSRTILLSDMPTNLPAIGTKCLLEDNCLHVEPSPGRPGHDGSLQE